MMKFLKQRLSPLVRLPKVEHQPHDRVFDTFVQNMGRALVDERVRHEPRIVSFARRRGL